MNEIITRIIPLPLSINGVTAKDENDDYNIYINALIPYDLQLKAYLHEKCHIELGHFYDDRSVEVKEGEVNGKG